MRYTLRELRQWRHGHLVRLAAIDQVCAALTQESSPLARPTAKYDASRSPSWFPESVYRKQCAEPKYRVPLIPLLSLLSVPPGTKIHCVRPGLPIPPGAVILPVTYMDELARPAPRFHPSWSPYSENEYRLDDSYGESEDSNIVIQLPPC